MTNQAFTIVIIILLTVISGIGDSQGFIHAALVWKKNIIDWGEILKSALGFMVGIGAYWLVIKYLNQVGITSAELQTLGWFGITLIGVAIASGEFIKWATIDKLVAILVLTGIGWLMFHAKA